MNPTRGSEPGLAAPPPGIRSAFDATRAHPARVYDYLLGGKDNFVADRQAADQVARQAPWVIAGARAFSELRPPVSRWGPKREAPPRRPVGRRKALPPFAKAGYGTSRSQPDTGGLRLFSQQVTLRTPDQIAALFTGLDLLAPGLVGVHEWHPPRGRRLPPVPVLAGVGALSPPSRSQHRERCWP